MRLWAIAFATGILIVQQLSSLPAVYWLMIGLLVIIALKPFTKLTTHNGLPVLVSGLAFGFAWALGHAHWMMSQRLLPDYEGIDIQLEGQISSLPQTSASHFLPKTAPHVSSFHSGDFNQTAIGFDFSPTKIISTNKVLGSLVLARFPKRIRLTWYKPTVRVAAGQFWRFSVRLKRPYALMNPGGFDYENWMFQHRIQAKGTIRNDNNIQIISAGILNSGIKEFLLEFRQTILDKLSTKIDIGEHSGFIRDATQALILGYRAGLDASQWRTFQRTGTTHLMAISGLHIGLVAALVYGLVGMFWRLLGRGCLVLAAPQVAAVAALLAAILYAVLAGFTIPTQRALVMLLVAMLHVVFKRTPLPASKTIALALVLVLLLDPLAGLAQGFWLSFLAVSLIIYFIQQINGRMNLNSLAANDSLNMKEEKSYLRGVIHKTGLSIIKFGQMQWSLTIAMLPLVVYFYQSSSLVSPLANFVAIPVVSFAVVPLMFVATLFLFISPPIANMFFKVVDYIYSGLMQFLEMLSQWQYATLDFSIVSLWGMLLCYLAIGLWLCVKGTPMRWLALVLVLPVVFYADSEIKPGEAIVTVLDVGQGLSAVIQTSNHTVLFDTGPKYSENFDTGRAVVVPYLRQIGRTHIDTLIISHADNDHIGGFTSVAAMLPIKRVLTSVPEAREFNSNGPKHYITSVCEAGQKWQYDGVEFDILSPGELLPTENGHDENNQSCVLKVTTQFGRVLMTADIERETESYLYHTLPLELAAEILIVPHHGSSTSSLAGFIQAVAPRYAVFAVGYKNRYQHPNKNITSRYRALSQAELLKSNATGAITFKLDHDSTLQPHLYRQQGRHYWHTEDMAAF